MYSYKTTATVLKDSIGTVVASHWSGLDRILFNEGFRVPVSGDPHKAEMDRTAEFFKNNSIGAAEFSIESNGSEFPKIHHTVFVNWKLLEFDETYS
jgi:hypothetical protein